VFEVGGEPRGGNGVTNVVGIEECDQNVDIEQRAHSGGILFAQPIYLFIGNYTTPTFERHESAHSGASRYRWSTGECAAGEFGQHCPCRSIRLPGQAVGSLQNVVINL